MRLGPTRSPILSNHSISTMDLSLDLILAHIILSLRDTARYFEQL